ncbi:MAG TPA: acyltransferase [Terracidiphilus sp.]|nr:acyltransferase [Terracidiphilus sp.]
MRFLAFFLVFCSHLVTRLFIDRSVQHAALVQLPIFNVFLLAIPESCAMGLCLFFCLSAYLITGILLAERNKAGTVSVRRFYIRRILRIWPLYVFGLLLGVLWAWFNHLPQWGRLAAYAFFAGNVYCAAYGWSVNPLTPLWSISVEEQFYLIWPWAMRFFSRRGLWMMSILFIVIANISLFRLGKEHASEEYTVWGNTFVQFEMFATGIMLALLKRPRATSSARAIFLILTGPFLWYLSCVFFRTKVVSDFGVPPSGPTLAAGYALAALGCAGILSGFCMLDSSRLPKWSVDLGKISYGLYVYHLLVYSLLLDVLGRAHSVAGWCLLIALSLLLTIAAAKLSYVFLESPFLRLKRRFEILHTRPV